MVMHVVFSVDQVISAQVRADKVSRALNGKNYTALCAPRRYMVGFLGEDGFEGLLKAHAVRYQTARRTDGLADAFDYEVFISDHPYTLDLKTASERHHKRVAMPDVQWSRHRHDIVVGARLDGPRSASYHGWAIAPDVDAWQVGYMGDSGVLTRFAALDGLRQLESLFEQLDKVQ